MLWIASVARAQDSAPPPRPVGGAFTPADSALEARVAAVSATLRCPVCQGESIQDSPAQLAQEMRAVVREQLRAGKTPEEIRAYFVGRYGEWILLEPAMTGLNILLYVFPVALVVGGLVLIAVLVKRWSTPAQPSTQ
jgi:cytochrome c-type biogenesis protein CcmH